MADNLLLFLAVKEGNLSEVKRLLSQGHDIGKVYPETGINSLHLAVLIGNYDIVELLSRDEVHINSTCKSPKSGSKEWSWNHAWDINAVGGYCVGYTPLHFSVDLGDKDITKLLLSRKANVNMQTKYGSTPLHLAASNGFILKNKDFLIYNEKYLHDFSFGHLIKKCPTINEYCDITDILLQSGANAQLLNFFNETALHFACELENDSVAQIILKKCSSIVNYKDENGSTALHIATRNYNNLELVKLLIEYGADIDATDDYLSTPLCYACMNRKLDVVQILVENGCNVNLGGDEEPIDIAVKNGDGKILKLLLEHGVDTSHVLLNEEVWFSIFTHYSMDPEKYLFESCCKGFFKTKMNTFRGINLNNFPFDSSFEVFKLLLQRGCFKNIDGKKLCFFYKRSMITHFVKCVINLKTLGCLSARDYPDIDASNIDLQPDEEIYAENCKKEVLILRGIFVCSGISLLDFLKKDLNKIVRLLKNQEIASVLECLNYKILPMYRNFIKTFFKFAMERRSMLNRCYECFNVIFCQFPKLPDMVVETIFDSFTADDMRIFLTWDPFKLVSEH